jgi:NAD(P)-dependent dehydrogenase (short-subunit alcohol dehydrogenase family)
MDKSSAFPKQWSAADIPDQSGRTAIVTGASSGLGLVSAEQLAAHGARVVMAVRNVTKGERVRAEIASLHPDARLEVRHLDVADLDSVARFAEQMAAETDQVDLLVNNAGIGGGPRRLSPQGYELTWATDFLGPFALTGRLLPLLEGANDARIVTVGSNLYKRISVNLPLDDPAAERSYSGFKAYVAAKLADLLFAVELERRLRANGSRVRSLAAHPGVANTPMQKSASSIPERVAARALSVVLGRSPETAAIPLLFAATAPDAPADKFVGPAFGKRDRRVHADPVVAPANDRELASRLWATAEALTGMAWRPAGAQAATRPATQ